MYFKNRGMFTKFLNRQFGLSDTSYYKSLVVAHNRHSLSSVVVHVMHGQPFVGSCPIHAYIRPTFGELLAQRSDGGLQVWMRQLLV